MALKLNIAPLWVFFMLFSVLVTADSSSGPYPNRTADGYGGYCNMTVIDPDLDCSSKFAADYYSFGVRLGVYFSWLASWIANVFLPEEIASALDANTMFLLSLMASIFYSTHQGILSYIDGLILMHLSSGYLFGCLSFWGYRTRHYHHEGPMGIRHFGRFGTHCRLVLALAISAYGIWFWTDGVSDGLQIPISPNTGDLISCQCYPLKTFFFSRLRVYGGIRYFYIVMTICSTTYYGLMILAAVVERIHHIVHVLNQTKPVFETVIYETGLTHKELDFLFKVLSIGNLIWMIFAVLMVEMTLNYNNVKNVISLLETFYPAQLLPMLIGAFGLVRILFLLAWSIYEPEDKEQGESATAPPEDAQGNPSAENRIREDEMRGGDQKLEVRSKEMPLSPERSPITAGTTILGHDEDHNLVSVRRSAIRRYLVAWLPWLSQFSFWTKPYGGYQHTRARSKAWAFPRNFGNLGDSTLRDSRMTFLRRRPKKPTADFESSARGDKPSSQLTSPTHSMVKSDEKQTEASPSPPPARRRRTPSSRASSPASVDEATQLDGDTQNNAASSHEQLVKKLVRLALASEYSRQPLRRADINAKVFAPNSTRAFKPVFASAQSALRHTFGMTLTPLPTKEKITVSQKRAAQRATGTSQGNASASPAAWILTSTLPANLRAPAILPPPKVPSSAPEAGYVGLYTFVVSVIYLSEGGRCSETKLERALRRVNAGEFVGGEKTDRVLKRMEREGYVVKVREREAGGEESVEWVVGPRGRVEVGEMGVAGLVRGVYAGDRNGDVEGLEKRLEKSLGVGKAGRGRDEGDEGEVGGEVREDAGGSEEEQDERRPARRSSARSGTRGADAGDEEEEEEEEGEEEEEDGDD
ncbi:Altered inheritance of mitochondria protein 18 mitochondrial [Xylographa soralifera]|nr:Altered inheritance of mitochondria protein 18 mitochondrial [Xylographa soralifera]